MVLAALPCGCGGGSGGGGSNDNDDGGADGCVPENPAVFCARHQTHCGMLTAPDNCGETRTVPCGECGGQTCTEWTCGAFDGPCDTTGTETRDCTGFACVSGQCEPDSWAEQRDCTRDTENNACNPSYGGVCRSGRCALEATNPVLGFDHPDPHVLRTTGSDGRPIYHLLATVHNSGDIPVFVSRDLISWQLASAGLFGRTSTPGNSIQIHDGHFCSIWAPQIVELGPQSYLLSFSAQRFTVPQAPCPAYHEDGGVYLAWSSSPTGPFADGNHPWEPIPAGGHITNCAIRDSLPRSLWTSSEDCQGGYCHQVIRLDSDVWRDPSTGRWWLGYSWYTNRPPLVPWEYDNHGEHVHLVELDGADPFTVICDPTVPQIHTANPHDLSTLAGLGAYCTGCDQMLSMTRGRFGEELVFDGYSWGIAEGVNLFRRAGYVYMLISGSAWDSAYYHVYWVAAADVESLSFDNPNRLVGRFLVPGRPDPNDPQSPDWAFGHGTAVLGPDDDAWYFVHHRLDNTACRTSGDCRRDVWVSPIQFEDRNDGLGEVWITPLWPAQRPDVRVLLP